MSALSLVMFDVDGTLVDSQHEIVTAARTAFASETIDPPSRTGILSIVGLSLDQAMTRLAPGLPETRRQRLVAAYRQAYFGHRKANGAPPLFDGARAALEALSETPHLLMGVATGKSKRGLDALIEAHGLDRFFVTRQVADFHPSKPHPSMLQAAFSETGIKPDDAVMVGDTSYDMDMARAAGCGAIAVGWGYHPAAQLKADTVVQDFSALSGAIAEFVDGTTENRS